MPPNEKKPPSKSWARLWFFLLLLGILGFGFSMLFQWFTPENDVAEEFGLTTQPTTQPTTEPTTQPVTTQEIPEPVVTPSEDRSEVATAPEADADGPLGGTWTMMWINAENNEKPAFTIRFIGQTSGTIEIAEDSTEYETAFELDGDALSFSFIRLVGGREVPELSKWEGTLVDDEFTGTWYRQDWVCPPAPSECEVGPGFTSFASSLIRVG